MLSSSTLGAYILSFPSLTPQSESLAPIPVQDGAKMPLKELVDIITETEPLSLKLNQYGFETAKKCDPRTSTYWKEWENACPGFLEELFDMHMDPGEESTAPSKPPPIQQVDRKRKDSLHSTTGSQFSSKRRRQSGDPKLNTTLVLMPSLLDADQPMEQGYTDEDPSAALTKMLNDFIDRGRAATSTDQVARELTSFVSAMSVEVARLRTLSYMDKVPVELFREAFALMISCVSDCTMRLSTGAQLGDDSKDANVNGMMRAVIIMLSVAAGMSGKATNVCSDALLEASTSFLDCFLSKHILDPMDALLSQQAKQVAETPKGNKKLRQEHDAALNECAGRSSHVCQCLIEFNEIVRQHPIQDKELLRVTGMCISAFFHDGAEHLHILQSVSIPLMQSILAGYEAHRHNTLNEIFARIGTWQHVTRKERCFQLPAPAVGHVQMLSALLLAMFQGCNAPPPQALKLESGTAKAHGSAPAQQTPAPAKKPQPALNLMFTFINKILNKFAETEKAGKKADRDNSLSHKKFFETFSEDVCTVLGLPEFPIAVLTQRLLWKLSYSTAVADTYHMTFRTLATDILGNILLALKRHSLQAPKFLTDATLPNILRKAAASSDTHMRQASVNTEVTTTQAAVSDMAETAALLREQQCNVLYRVAAGHTAIEEVMRAWEGDDKDELATRTQMYSLYCKQLLLNHLTSRALTIDKALCYSRQAYIAEWCDEQGTLDSVLTCWSAQWDLPLEVSSSSAPLPLPHEAAEAARHLLVTSMMQKGFDHVLVPLLVLLKHANQALRQKALKALARIVELDHETLSQDTVRMGVCSLMSDASTSVRATAVSLVGNYMCLNSQLMVKYFDSICARCRDTGSSVRKTAMNILKDCLAREVLEPQLVERACVAMVPLLLDESQDIRNRTSAILKDMWFPPPAPESKRSAAVAAVKRPSLESRFDQIKGVIAAAHETHSRDPRVAVLDMLEQFFREAMHEDPSKERTCREYCEHGVQVVIREHEDRAGTRDSAQLDKVHLQLFRTLALFAKAKPELLVKQAQLLHNYLTGHEDNSGAWTAEQCELTGTVASIYNCVLPHMKPLPPTLVKYLQMDLPRLIHHAPALTLITTSVQCLCTLAKSVGKSQGQVAKRMLELLKKFFLQTYSALDKKEDRFKARAVFICGILCRYSNFRLLVPVEGSSSTMPDTPISTASVTELYDACIREYCLHQDNALRRAAYMCLGNIFVRQPALVLRDTSSHIVTLGLADTQSNDVRLVVLRALTDFILAGDEPAEEDADPEDLKGASCMRNTVMQQYLQQILNCSYSDSDQVALAALRLVAHTYERGQVHPQLCITDLVAVQQRGDECANVAQHVLRTIVQKHSVYCTPEVWIMGVLRSFKLVKEGKPIMVDFFSRTFDLRSNEKAFVQRTIKYGIEKVRQRLTEQESMDIIDKLRSKCFLLTVLASLPYAHEDHVSLIVRLTEEAGVELGGCLTSYEADENFAEGMFDDDLIKVCEEASLSYMLLEAKRFLAHTYRVVLSGTGKAPLPLDVPHLEIAVLLTSVQDLQKSVRECFSKLEHAVHVAATETSRANRKTAKVGKGHRASRGKNLGSDEDSSNDDDFEGLVGGAGAASAEKDRSALKRSGMKKGAKPKGGMSKQTVTKDVMKLDDDDDDDGTESDLEHGESSEEEWP